MFTSLNLSKFSIYYTFSYLLTFSYQEDKNARDEWRILIALLRSL